MNEKVKYEVGDCVKKNPDTWVPNDFDSWDRGIGIGQVVDPQFFIEDNKVDVRWSTGRCFEFTEQLLPASEPEIEDTNS